MSIAKNQFTLPVNSDLDCFGFCRKNQHCHWISYDSVEKDCYLFENCEETDIESCPNCLSSENECAIYTCDVSGICNKVYFQLHHLIENSENYFKL